MDIAVEHILNFLKDLDREVNFKTPVSLYLIGGAAITLAYDHRNRTADLDFIDPPEIFLKKGGIGSHLAKKHNIYVSSVYEINFSAPDNWRQKAKKITLPLKHFELFVASLEDIILGKLACMEPKDLEDIISLKDQKLLNSTKLIKRLNENLHELKEPEYRNNVRFLFQEVFGISVAIRKGKLIVKGHRNEE